MKIVTHGGRPVGITTDEISPIAFLLGVFAALTPAATSQLLGSELGPCLECPGRLTIVRWRGVARLAPELRAAWPFEPGAEELWEIRRISGALSPKISVLLGAALRELAASVHGERLEVTRA